MRGLARGAATTAVVALVLTACGLAATTSPALAPDVVSHQAVEAVKAVAPAAQKPPEHAALLQKFAPEPQAVAKPTLAAASTAPMRHIWQSLNNCGPASVVMALSTLGVDVDQETARLALRGPDWRRGMGPQSVGPWVGELYGLRSTWRNNGTNAVIKALISNGFAPMVTQWMEDPWVSRIAHWRAVAGYDDRTGAFYVNDPMRGRGVALTYEWFDKNWQQFSYRYMVIYRPEDEPLLRAIVGEEWNDRVMRQRFYERGRMEALERNDAASWLAYGESAYQNGLFAEAVAAFEKGLALGSATGVFTLRSSYPQALRALGRDKEASAAQQMLSGISSVPATVAAPPDAIAVQIAQDRARLDGVLFSE